jgi:hypothetical protein
MASDVHFWTSGEVVAWAAPYGPGIVMIQGIPVLYIITASTLESPMALERAALREE